MSEVDRSDSAEVGGPVQGDVRADGPVVVVTAMSLKPAARDALAQRLGPGHIVRDIKDAGHTAHIVLVPAVSAQLVGSLREMFPGAKVLVTELSDVEFGVDLPGPVSRIMRSGVDGYFVAPDLGQLAAVTREAVQDVPRIALTTGGLPPARWELEPGNDPRGRAVLRFATSSEDALRAAPQCFALDVAAWLQQLHPDGAGPAERQRCMDLAWVMAVQVLECGLDVLAAGVDQAEWRLRAHGRGIQVE